MCGRYAITTAPEAIRQLFRYLEQPNFPPRYNVAPTQPVPIVRMTEGKRQFALVRWGLIPAWVKDPRAFSLVINARAESVLDKPAFKNAMKYRRCLFPADGFFEWERKGDRKQPYFVRLKGGGSLAFAGLWESWMGPNGEEQETAAIITTDASPSIAHIHDRMPVILAPDAFDFWLDPKVDAEMAMAVIAPAKDEAIEHYEVSRAVNRHENDSAMLVEPLREPEAVEEAPASKRARKETQDDRQGSLF
ncbi:MAG: SOS response-associated peptidase [Xanthobacteraceae bacterium]